MITNKETRLLSQIAADSESGNHLLRGREPEYWGLCKELAAAITNKNEGKELSSRENELVDAYKSCFHE